MGNISNVFVQTKLTVSHQNVVDYSRFVYVLHQNVVDCSRFVYDLHQYVVD